MDDLKHKINFDYVYSSLQKGDKKDKKSAQVVFFTPLLIFGKINPLKLLRVH